MKITPDFKRLNSGENISRGLEISLSEGLLDKKCVITFITPMGKIFVTEPLEITDGKGTYELPSLLLDGKGVLFCQLGLSGEDGFLIKSKIYEFPVYASCDTEEFPAATDESIKSLSAIFSLLDKKSDIGHMHDERYYTEAETDIFLFGKSDKEHSHGEFYTKEETGVLLGKKADSEHSHRYASLSEKPGDKIFEDLVIYDLLPVFTPPENSFVTGKMFPFTHKIKGYTNTSVLKLEYSVPGQPIILGEQRFINFEALSDGGYFIPFGAMGSYEKFFANGFGEISADTLAAAVILSSDGTGKIYIRNDIDGITARLSIRNVLTGYVKLPTEAIDCTESAEENDMRLITSGGVADALSGHNVSGTSHQDIRLLLQELGSRINAVLDSDDTTLDQLSEIVSYIKSNKALIDAVTTKKISYSDIVNNLETNASGKPLSAAMGVALKGLIDAITVPTKLSQLQNDSNFVDGKTLENEIADSVPLYITALADFKKNSVTGFSSSADEIFEARKRGRQVILAAEIVGTFLEDIPDGILTMPMTALYDGQYALFTAVVDETEYRIFAANHDMGDGTYQTALFATVYTLAGKGDVTALGDRVTALEEAASESSDGIFRIGAFLTMDENGNFILKDVDSTVSEILELAAENKAVVLDIALDGDYAGDQSVSVPLTLSSQNEKFLCFNSVIDIDTVPSFLRIFGRVNEEADSWIAELIPIEETASESSDGIFHIGAFLTADENGNFILEDVDSTVSEILELSAENKTVMLEIALDGDVAGEQKISVPLVMSSQNEKMLLFSGISEINGPTFVQFVGSIYDGADSWSVNLITLVSASRLARLNLVVSDTVPTVDDPSVITFVTEE